VLRLGGKITLRKYEELLVVKPELSQEQVDSLLDKIKEQITQNGGNVIEAKLWEKKKLAYEIEKYNEGIYLLTIFEMAPAELDKLGRFCKLEQDIIRFIFVKQ